MDRKHFFIVFNSVFCDILWLYVTAERWKDRRVERDEKQHATKYMHGLQVKPKGRHDASTFLYSNFLY